MPSSESFRDEVRAWLDAGSSTDRIHQKRTEATLPAADRAGNADGNHASFIKYYNSEQNKRKYDLLLQVMGTGMLGWEGVSVDEVETATMVGERLVNEIIWGKVR